MATRPNALRFDPETHVYTIDGVPVPSVTQVIHRVMPGWAVDDWYLGRGRAIHHGCELFDRGTLDWSSVADEIKPRIEAWGKFRADFPVEPIASECSLGHPTFRFAGTLDRLMESRLHGRVLLDIKSSIAPQVWPQLGGYSLLLRQPNQSLIAPHPPIDLVEAAAAVELRENGTYSVQWIDKRELKRCEQVFLGCLTVHNFMEKHNIKGNR